MDLSKVFDEFYKRSVYSSVTVTVSHKYRIQTFGQHSKTGIIYDKKGYKFVFATNDAYNIYY